MLAAPLPYVIGDASAKPVHVVRPAGMASLLNSLPQQQRSWLQDGGFAARPTELAFLPGADGMAGAVFGIGVDTGPLIFGELPFRLPPTRNWRLLPGDYDLDNAVQGYLLGAYRYRRFRPPLREPAILSLKAPAAHAESIARAVWMARDLINAPANVLGPSELADAAIALAEDFGANPYRVDGDRMARDYPAVAAVGAGSLRPPVVAGFSWRGSAATDNSPLIALCGKGVCFDSGGYDIKSSDGMLRMKKDMGGAAIVLGVARVLMEADLPLRLLVRIGCVENSISGHAMRPGDVIATRRGLSVEIGNTDAEGRLVLADLLAEASDACPDLLIDCATLTGAARAALGPDLAAMFTESANWAGWLLNAGRSVRDPVWRLPLWDGYDTWLDSSIADLNNVAAKPNAGAVVAALFLRRFVKPNTTWVHLDVYAWNDTTRPGRPEGGEAQALRAIYAAIEEKLTVMTADRNTPVT